MSGEQCGGCPHAAHRGPCKGKGPSRCVSIAGDDGKTVRMTACFARRPPCPCSWQNCLDCGTPIAVAIDVGAPAPDAPDADPAVIEIVRGSAKAPNGLVAAWKGPDGGLYGRRLEPGQEPGEGEWRGREHAVCKTAKGGGG